jgi:hypothetical protein
LKYTPVNCPDSTNINKAIEAVSGVVEIVNERKRQAENQAKILSISNSISWFPEEEFTLIDPRRVFSCEQDFKEITSQKYN